MAEEFKDFSGNAPENEFKNELHENNEPKEKKINKKALIAGILGLVSGALFFAFSVLFFTGITTFDASSVPEEKQAGAAFAAIFIIILFMIPITASGIVAGLFEIGRSIVYFTQVGGNGKSRIGVLIAFIVLKLVYCVVVGYGAAIFASFSDYINPIILYSGSVAGIGAILCSLAVIPFGFLARQRDVASKQDDDSL